MGNGRGRRYRCRRQSRPEQGNRVAAAHNETTCQENGDVCDLVLFSKVSTRFTLERIMDRVGSHVVTIWASDECISETTEARGLQVQHDCRICRDQHRDCQQQQPLVSVMSASNSSSVSCRIFCPIRM